MLFFMFFIIEVLSLYFGLFNQYLTYLQLSLAYLGAYTCGVNSSNRNINSAIVVFLYCVMMSFASLFSSSLNPEYKYILIMVFIWFLSFQRYKLYNIKSDDFNNDNVMLLFYKPKTLREHFLALFGNDTSTMSVVCGEKWAKFKWECQNVCIVEFDKNLINENYIIIDTEVKITEDIIHILHSLKNNKARTLESLYLRLNCVRTFKPLLYELGEPWKYKFLDFLPSHYLFRRCKFEKK